MALSAPGGRRRPQRGDIYKVAPLEYNVRCTQCGELFEGQAYVTACPFCGAENSPDHVQRGYRPVLIVQSDQAMPILTTVITVPITSSDKARDKLGAVPLQIEGETSYALCWQPRTIAKSNLFPTRYVTTAPQDVLEQVMKWLEYFVQGV